MTAITMPVNTEWYVDNKFHLPLDVTWPRKIFSYQNLPVDFQRIFSNYSPFPYTVFLPGEHDGMFGSTSRKLVALTDDTLLVMSQEAHKKPVVSHVYPLDSIVRVEYGNVLLRSLLRVGNASHTTDISFPSVAEHLFTPVLSRILGYERPAEPVKSEHRQSETALNYLSEVNLKLFNAARKYCLTQEAVVETAYQPEVELSGLRVFGAPLYKRYVTGHLAVLTDTAIVLIKESQTVASHTTPVYGEVLTYLPLRHIRHVAFEEVPGTLDCVMNVILSNNHPVRTEFSTATAMQLERFKEACLKRVK